METYAEAGSVLSTSGSLLVLRLDHNAEKKCSEVAAHAIPACPLPLCRLQQVFVSWELIVLSQSAWSWRGVALGLMTLERADGYYCTRYYSHASGSWACHGCLLDILSLLGHRDGHYSVNLLFSCGISSHRISPKVGRGGRSRVSMLSCPENELVLIVSTWTPASSCPEGSSIWA